MRRVQQSNTPSSDALRELGSRDVQVNARISGARTRRGWGFDDQKVESGARKPSGSRLVSQPRREKPVQNSGHTAIC